MSVFMTLSSKQINLPQTTPWRVHSKKGGPAFCLTATWHSSCMSTWCVFRSWGKWEEGGLWKKSSFFASAKYTWERGFFFGELFIGRCVYVYIYVIVDLVLCNTLQRTAAYCNTLRHAGSGLGARSDWQLCDTLQHTATHCNTLQHAGSGLGVRSDLHLCNVLQHTATHCNTLHHTATHCSTLQHAATHCNTQGLGLGARSNLHLCNALQHTATHCNTLQHTATRRVRAGSQERLALV